MRPLARQQQGITLIELIVSVALMAILLTVAMPSYRDMLERAELKSAGSKIYDYCLIAHSQAITFQQAIDMDIQTGAAWCIGVSDAGPCDCSTANDCQFAGGPATLQGSDFSALTLSTSNFSSGKISVDRNRGLFSDAGTLTLSRGGKQMSVSVSVNGKVETCSNDLSGYRAC